MPPRSSWRVTGQATDQVVNTQAGQTIVGVQVFFITGKGVEGSVFIPNTQYNPKAVRSTVAAQAAILDEVAGLAEGDFA